MEPSCEVCESFCPEASRKAGRELTIITLGERSLRLCRGHAAIARNAGVTTLAQFRALYAESKGQRSYIARRAQRLRADTGPVRSAGRRASDFAR